MSEKMYLPPQDMDAEKGILRVLVGSDELIAVAFQSGLRPKHFYGRKNGDEYDALLREMRPSERGVCEIPVRRVSDMARSIRKAYERRLLINLGGALMDFGYTGTDAQAKKVIDLIDETDQERAFDELEARRAVKVAGRGSGD